VPRRPLEGPPGTPAQPPRRAGRGLSHRPVGRRLGNPPPRPLPGVSAPASTAPWTPFGGGVRAPSGDPRGTLPRPLRDVSQNPSTSSATPPQRGHPQKPATSSRTTAQSGLQNPPTRSATALPGGLPDDDLNPSPRRLRRGSPSTSPRAPTPPLQEVSQTTSTRAPSARREGLRETSRDHSTRSVGTHSERSHTPPKAARP
jgi:hypothetical protein